MKFYGKGIVWDGTLNKSLCEFDKNGELIVEDDRVIDQLLSLGYRSEFPREIKVEVPTVEKEVVVQLDGKTLADVLEKKEPEKEVKKVVRKPRTKKAVSK